LTFIALSRDLLLPVSLSIQGPFSSSRAAGGLRLFSSHASEEIGSFTALQMGEIMEAWRVGSWMKFLG